MNIEKGNTWKPRVLVMDDDESVLQLVVDLLEKEKIEITTAINGLEGMRLFKKFPADLVIVDIIMPGLEGLEIVRYITQNYPDTEIIAISGAQAEYLENARIFGAKYTFSKPFEIEAFMSIIRSILERKRREHQG